MPPLMGFDPSVFASLETKRHSCPFEVTNEVTVAPKGCTVAQAPEVLCLIVTGVELIVSSAHYYDGELLRLSVR